MERDMYECIDIAQVKLFFEDFSEQTEVTSQMDGSNLKFSFMKDQIREQLQKFADYYTRCSS